MMNSTSYVILGLLSIQPDLSGYDMRKGIQSSIGYFWGESYGQIYPALKRLVGEGMIAPTKAGAKGRKGRQTYRLTAAGRAALRQWLALSFHNEPPRNEFMLKLFFAREAAPGVAAAQVMDLNERNRRALELIENIRAGVSAEQRSNPHFAYWMLVLGLGETLTRAALEWGQAALAALGADGQIAPPAARSQAGSAGRPAASSRKRLPDQRGSARPLRRVAR
jgi:DNA-binding PadR family transcriptional regulator